MILLRNAQANAAFTRQKSIWRDSIISLGLKVKHFLVSFIFFLCLLTQAVRMRCYQRPVNISYSDQVTNEEVGRQIEAATGECDGFLI